MAGSVTIRQIQELVLDMFRLGQGSGPPEAQYLPLLTGRATAGRTLGDRICRNQSQAVRAIEHGAR